MTTVIAVSLFSGISEEEKEQETQKAEEENKIINSLRISRGLNSLKLILFKKFAVYANILKAKFQDSFCKIIIFISKINIHQFNAANKIYLKEIADMRKNWYIRLLIA